MEITNATTASRTGVANTTSQPNLVSSDFETFLRMLTVQMQNQDPLDPVKSEDFAVQLATFSGVEQQVRTNNLLESLLGQNVLDGMTQYANWVGMEVRAPTSAYFDGTPITLSPNPPVIADEVTLVVYDDNGDEVERISIPADGNDFTWDGELADGTAATGHYSFSVESSANGELIETRTAEVYSSVVEARLEGGEMFLIDAGGRAILAAEVSGLREPVDA